MGGSVLTLLFFEFFCVLVDVGEGTQSFTICPPVCDPDRQIEWRRDEPAIVSLTLGFFVIFVTLSEQSDEQFPDTEGHDVYEGGCRVKVFTCLLVTVSSVEIPRV